MFLSYRLLRSLRLPRNDRFCVISSVTDQVSLRASLRVRQSLLRAERSNLRVEVIPSYSKVWTRAARVERLLLINPYEISRNHKVDGSEIIIGQAIKKLLLGQKLFDAENPS